MKHWLLFGALAAFALAVGSWSLLFWFPCSYRGEFVFTARPDFEVLIRGICEQIRAGSSSEITLRCQGSPERRTIFQFLIIGKTREAANADAQKIREAITGDNRTLYQIFLVGDIPPTRWYGHWGGFILFVVSPVAAVIFGLLCIVGFFLAYWMNRHDGKMPPPPGPTKFDEY